MSKPRKKIKNSSSFDEKFKELKRRADKRSASEAQTAKNSKADSVSQNQSDSESEFTRAYDQAIKLLGIRHHTVGEIQQKLQRRKYDSEVIKKVIADLEENDLLDDALAARMMIDNFKAYKDFGYYGVKMRLLKKMIPSEVAERTLQENFSVSEERAIAGRLVKKLKQRDRTSYEQVGRSLQSKGFRSEIFYETMESFRSAEIESE